VIATNVRIFYNSFLPKLLGTNGVTISPYIFISSSEKETPKSLIKHEMVHIKQVEKIGWIWFYLSYFLYYFAGLMRYKKHMIAYRKIPYEIEAYQKELEG